MPKLSEKIKTGLDEVRMVTMATQVFLGFQLRSFFEPRYDSLTRSGRTFLFAAALGLAGSMVLLMFPGAWHRRVDSGHATSRLKCILDVSATAALGLLALVLGSDLLVAGMLMGSVKLGVVLGAAAIVVAFVLWFGLEWMKGIPPDPEPRATVEKVGLHDRIVAVLTESRVVLPGTQALLGFQFAMLMMESFEKLPPQFRGLHCGALVGTALAIVLLMTPAAWHRLVLRGEDSESFHRLASRFLLAAMVVFACALSADIAVIAKRIDLTDAECAGVGASFLALFLFCWFVVTGLASRSTSAEVRRSR